MDKNYDICKINALLVNSFTTTAKDSKKVLKNDFTLEHEYQTKDRNSFHLLTQKIKVREKEFH